MIRRPKATDTEDDLLAFQEKFLSSGEKPSASVDAQRKVKVGSKRLQQASQGTTETLSQARDVVDLQMEGYFSLYSAMSDTCFVCCIHVITRLHVCSSTQLVIKLAAFHSQQGGLPSLHQKGQSSKSKD